MSATTDGILTSSTDVLLDQGGAFGVLAIVLIVALVVVYRSKIKSDNALIAEKDARLKDAKDFTDSITPLLRELKDTSVKQTEQNQKIYESILSSNRGA